MGMEVNQTDSSRNYSRAEYTQKKVFIFDNRYREQVVANTPNIELLVGTIVRRTAAGKIEPMKVTEFQSDPNDMVGILATDVEGTDKTVQMASSGSVSSNHLLVLNEGGTALVSVSLNTKETTGNRTIADYLTNLGFHLVASVENTKIEE